MDFEKHGTGGVLKRPNRDSKGINSGDDDGSLKRGESGGFDTNNLLDLSGN